mmetsp:Transcript_14723/g.36455  ORF Transcript_14723/g.36455 Transcript_14723/m.36455 type:complete len:88 (-) Transcript_14723:93-356(-)
MVAAELLSPAVARQRRQQQLLLPPPLLPLLLPQLPPLPPLRRRRRRRRHPYTDRSGAARQRTAKRVVSYGEEIDRPPRANLYWQHVV